jgi:predicted nucleotidyltransferase component of viral defense system
MLDEVLLQQITETADLLSLQPAIIEKDYYVAKVINSLAAIEDDNFSLIFCGGTCLAKAHKIVQRMSEDIDFKIKYKHNAQTISKSKFSNILRSFKKQLSTVLHDLSLSVKNIVSRNEGRYYKADVRYNSVFAAHEVLRPHLLIEFSVSDVRLVTKSLSVRTLIEETLNIIHSHDLNLVNCISSIETAIEKWVALTRKIIAIERGYYHDDPSLIRHVYDLAAINNQNLIGNEFYNLSTSIIYIDAKQFKNQHSEYAIDPCAEIILSLQILKENPIWQERYEFFLESMVFGADEIPTYQESIMTIDKISNNVLKQFNQENFELLMLADSRLNEKDQSIRVNLEDL